MSSVEVIVTSFKFRLNSSSLKVRCVTMIHGTLCSVQEGFSRDLNGLCACVVSVFLGGSNLICFNMRNRDVPRGLTVRSSDSRLRALHVSLDFDSIELLGSKHRLQRVEVRYFSVLTLYNHDYQERLPQNLTASSTEKLDVLNVYLDAVCAGLIWSGSTLQNSAVTLTVVSRVLH